MCTVVALGLDMCGMRVIGGFKHLNGGAEVLGGEVAFGGVVRERSAAQDSKVG